MATWELSAFRIPEQCSGSSPIDRRADIYALGVMLFEMLAGRPPFVAEGLGELFALHMFQPAPTLADLAPSVPPHMVAAVMKAFIMACRMTAFFPVFTGFQMPIIGVAVAPSVAVVNVAFEMDVAVMPVEKR